MSEEGQVSQDIGVLVVEDDPSNMAVVVRSLALANIVPLTAVTGEEALGLLDGGHQLDLILMDIKLPGMSGYEVTKEIRAREEGTERHTMIVALTAYAMVGDREKSLMAGMDGHIDKPMRREELVGVLRAVTLLKSAWST